MRRLADFPRVGRYVWIALVALLAALLLWVDRDADHAVQSRGDVAIHFKTRTGSAHVLGATRVFSRMHALSAGRVDPRDRWFRIEVPRHRAANVVAGLERDPEIESAFIAPIVTLPHHTADEASCPITTPSFESYQGYLGPAPHGIDAPAAWRRGVRGQGVWFADVEGGWNAKHEDLPGARITHAGGRAMPGPYWRAHGTAVLGEVVGVDNGRGVVGIAPDVDRVFTSSIGDTTVADAIDAAAEAMRPGDVLLIELQGGGPRGAYLPVEYWDDVFDAIQAATRRGVIVIEAAGNGYEDLDHPAYRGKLVRKKRDSGAIMVGAGAPPREGFDDRARLDFSNYGGRVDVQGWGRKVATLDYGDLQNCAGDEDFVDRHYTGEFSGTSSASPIVAGAAVLLQSYAKQQGVTLSPQAVRDILARTGTPQTANRKQNIGPRPDLARALKQVRSVQSMLDAGDPILIADPTSSCTAFSR